MRTVYIATLHIVLRMSSLHVHYLLCYLLPFFSENLFCGFDAFSTLSLPVYTGKVTIVDNLAEDQIDYGFLSATENKDFFHSVYNEYMLHLLTRDHHHNNIPLINTNRPYSDSFMHSYINNCHHFNHFFLLACYFLLGKVPRGTELGACLLMNNRRWLRGAFWSHKQLALMPNHDKTSKSRGMSADAVRFLDKQSSCFVALPFLVLVRNASILFSLHLEQQKLASGFANFIFVETSGSALSGKHFGYKLRTYMTKTFHASVGSRLCRQMYCNFYKRFLNHYSFDAVAYNKRDQASHSAATENNIYGNDASDHPSAASDTWETHRFSSDLLHHKFFNISEHWDNVLMTTKSPQHSSAALSQRPHKRKHADLLAQPDPVSTSSIQQFQSDLKQFITDARDTVMHNQNQHHHVNRQLMDITQHMISATTGYVSGTTRSFVNINAATVSETTSQGQSSAPSTTFSIGTSSTTTSSQCQHAEMNTLVRPVLVKSNQ